MASQIRSPQSVIGNYNPSSYTANDWDNPDYIKVDDANYASCATDVHAVTKGIVAYDFGFDFPPDAIALEGIEVRITRYATGGGVATELYCFLSLDLGTTVSGSRADNSTPVASTDEIVSRGGSGDKWGDPVVGWSGVTLTDLEDDNFSFINSYQLLSFPNDYTIYLQYIEVEVFYSVPEAVCEIVSETTVEATASVETASSSDLSSESTIEAIPTTESASECNIQSETTVIAAPVADCELFGECLIHATLSGLIHGASAIHTVCAVVGHPNRIKKSSSNIAANCIVIPTARKMKFGAASISCVISRTSTAKVTHKGITNTLGITALQVAGRRTRRGISTIGGICTLSPTADLIEIIHASAQLSGFVDFSATPLLRAVPTKMYVDYLVIDAIGVDFDFKQIRVNYLAFDVLGKR